MGEGFGECDEEIELSSRLKSFVCMSCAVFGFEATRQEWFKYQESVYYEQGLLAKYYEDPNSVPQVGWWIGILSIGEVTADEAVGMAAALDRAKDWYIANPGQVPDWFSPFPVWSWDGYKEFVSELWLMVMLGVVEEFMRGGGFRVRVERKPYRVVLSRG